MDNEIDDILDKADMIHTDSDTSELPESPASANVKVWIHDFGVMFTMRDNKMSNVVAKIEKLIKIGVEKGWKPKWTDMPPVGVVTLPKPSGDVTNPVCGIHGTPMAWKTGVSKKSGKPYAFWSCATKNADNTWCTFKPEVKNG